MQTIFEFLNELKAQQQQRMVQSTNKERWLDVRNRSGRLLSV